MMQGTFLDNKKRQTTGATLALLAASSFLFVILGLGFCYLVFLMGGSREARNAHDAGTLNAGKSAPLVQISGTGSENEVYGAISESGRYSLKSINRGWGHCLLTMLNSRSMNMKGQGSRASTANEEKAWHAAEAISNRLSTSLNQQHNLEPYYR